MQHMGKYATTKESHNSNLQLFIRIKTSGQTEIDDFDAIPFATQTQNILRFQIQMDDIVPVHKFHRLA